MKKHFILHLIFSLIAFNGISQTPTLAITPNGMFDKVGDRFGNFYSLASLNTDPNAVNSLNPNLAAIAITQTLVAGKFMLHIEQGSLFDLSAPSASVLSQVCKDISSFINSSITNTAYIHIKCGDKSASASTATLNLLAGATQYYAYPSNANNFNHGILPGLVELSLKSGSNPINNLPVSIFPGTNSYYAGYLIIDETAPWNTNLSTSTISSSDYDMYSIMLHELGHLLGFTSLINYDGLSKFGVLDNYFTNYDKFLRANDGTTPLLVSSTASTCPNNNIQFNFSAFSNTILGASTGTVVDLSSSNYMKYVSNSNTTVAVFTPTCFSSGSSLSHFEDMYTLPPGFTTTCTPTPTSPGANNLYYVMSNANGSGDCFLKRYFTPEERNVFCDIGYSVSASYTSAALINGTNTTYNYSGGACSPTLTIVGNHDGVSAGLFTYTTTGTTYTLPFSALLANDTPSNSIEVSCLNLVYNNATLTTSSTQLNLTAQLGAGLVVLQYTPKDASGLAFGNPTYVFVYFIPANCPPPNPCDLVQNGGFETMASGNCGPLIPTLSPFNILSCWENYLAFPTFTIGGIQPIFPAIFSSGTTCAQGIFNLGNNTYNTVPPVNSYNGSNNTKVLGINYQPLSINSVPVNLKSQLAAPLIPGQSYVLSFWVINHNKNTSNNLNPNSLPLVLSFATSPAFAITPTLNFPTGLNTLKDFTITANNSWTQITATITIPSTLSLNQNALFVGIDPIKTNAISQLGVNQYFLCFLDDISISGSSSPFFTIPNINNCGAASYTNLAQYASSIPGAFSGVGVTTVAIGSNIQYNFSATSPGNYPVTFNYTGAGTCTGSITQNIIIAPPAPLTLSRITGCNGSVPIETITVSSPGNTVTPFYYWMPGYLIGATQTLNPGTYTVTGQFGSCLSSNTIVINAFSSCCNTTTPTFTESSITSSALVGGALRVMNSFTIQPGANIEFMSANMLMEPNIKITIAENGTLYINSSVINTCGNYLWKGIEVVKGGKLRIFNMSFGDCLIEDAETAIEVKANSTSSLNTEISIKNTIFNKNLNGISISNFTSTSMPFTFELSNCAFTCRDFPPTTSISTTQLMAPSLSTLGIASPYFDNSLYNLTTLKFPYTSVSPQIAIKLNSVGVTTNNVYHGIQIGDASNANNFNLFDSHHKFIDATNSNVVLRNNVFQNCSGPAVESVFTATTSMKGVLDLSPSSATVTNRFWDCRQAISGNRVYKFNMRHAIVRSTQNATNTANSALRFGVSMKTGNFDYIISQNEFTNIYDGINISVIPVTINSGTFNFSYIDAHDLIITSNTFSAGNVSGSFSNRAINVSSLFNIPWTNAPACNYTYMAGGGSVSNHCRGLTIDGNHINGALRGIAVNGVSNFQTNIQGNIISLRDDNIFNVAQQGIYLVNSMSGGNKPMQFQIAQNTVSGGTASVSNPLMSMVFSGNNMGIYSPSISCNEIQDSHKGFVFNGANSNVVWAGNIMQPMAQGLRLENAAVIGTQGGPSLVNANQWQGTWTNTLNFGTFVDLSSNANNSHLYVKSGNTTPPNNDGLGNQVNFYGSVNGNLINGSGGDFNCIGIPNNFVIPIPQSENYTNSQFYYIAKTALYRFLHFNDSLRVPGEELYQFYEDQAGTNMDKLLQLEEKLFQADVSAATTLYNSISVVDDDLVEVNYQRFYGLYLNYLNNVGDGVTLSSSDSTDLVNLCALCPGTNGACIYQARAMYNSIYGLNLDFNDCDASIGARGFSNSEDAEGVEIKKWDVELFPNPNNGNFALISKDEKEILEITINDVSGKELYKKHIQTNKYFYVINLPLQNGVYFITIKNKNNESSTKKMAIVK